MGIWSAGPVCAHVHVHVHNCKYTVIVTMVICKPCHEARLAPVNVQNYIPGSDGIFMISSLSLLGESLQFFMAQ